MLPSMNARTAEELVGWEQIDLYRFFSFMFAAPTAERYEWFARTDLAAVLARLAERLGCEGELTGVGVYSDYEEYESTYISLFDVGLPQPPVALLESAHAKSQPAQQTALENVSFYEVLGMKPNLSHYAPDHLVTQLEFLSVVRYTREKTPHAETRQSLARLERDFLERHLLDWLPAAQAKLDREQPPVFPVLLRLLLAFLEQQSAQLVRT